MLAGLAGFLAAVQMMFASLPSPAIAVQELFASGTLLRMHVVAHDDTPAMQSMKYAVRDAVQGCYLAHRPADAASMLDAASALLPCLADAATACARSLGFTGGVRVALATLPFDARTADGITLPAGEYPALMVYLGDARGRNWWGLIDPEMALALARIAPTLPEDAPILPRWDWSLRGFLQALFSPIFPEMEVEPDALHP